MTKKEFQPIFQDLKAFCSVYGKDEKEHWTARARVLFEALKDYPAHAVQRGVSHFLAGADLDCRFPPPGVILAAIQASYVPPPQEEPDEEPMSEEAWKEWCARLDEACREKRLKLDE